MKIRDVQTVAHVREALTSLLGSEATNEGGVLHVMAGVGTSERALRVLAIGPETPRSDDDGFMLGAARARAQAIVTTGAILRAEPRVRYTLQGPGSVARALAAHRETLGLSSPPVLLVLTSGRRFAWKHPALEGPLPVVVFTSPEAAAHLEAGRPGHARIVSAGAPSLAGAITWLQGNACPRITLEAGPSTSQYAYDEPAMIDALWLSRIAAAPETLPASSRGPAFAPARRLAALLPSASPAAIRPASGFRWVFRRRAR